MSQGNWQPLLEFQSRTSAEIVRGLLEAADVPTYLSAGGLAAGLEADFRLSVPPSLAHRARWILATSDFSESELNYLATGEFEPIS
ncbi:MAG: hypothetical protein CL908_02585 [Deltaproteobacteria bacterium]|jgi:hypothetical protein|nr:hypothetical protein [Deltaproteobacteria bacterium]